MLLGAQNPQPAYINFQDSDPTRSWQGSSLGLGAVGIRLGHVRIPYGPFRPSYAAHRKPRNMGFLACKQGFQPIGRRNRPCRERQKRAGRDPPVIPRDSELVDAGAAGPRQFQLEVGDPQRSRAATHATSENFTRGPSHKRHKTCNSLGSGPGALDKPAAPSGDGGDWTQRACRARPTHGDIPFPPSPGARSAMSARRSLIAGDAAAGARLATPRRGSRSM